MNTPSVREVVAAIEIAFDGVSRGDGITLHEADAIDNALSDSDRVAARLRDAESRWQDIPAEQIERACSSLCFVDAQGFHYYIPAFMRWSVQHYKDSDSLTVDTTIYRLDGVEGDAFQLFTNEQRRAIALFLRHMASKEVSEYADAPFAIKALEERWGRYAS